jgi:(p)ppGpp synthase/HD superfamily hydrolase
MAGDSVTVAERLARQAHKDQVDRAGQPYVGHLERVVANLLRRWPEATGDEIAAAWLHDVIEDTPCDADLLLRAGVPHGAVEVVKELTRPPGLTYHAWIKSLAALGSLSAVRVKLADNDDNTAPERVAAIAEGESMLRTRYLPARNLLEARIARAETNAPP